MSIGIFRIFFLKMFSDIMVILKDLPENLVKTPYTPLVIPNAISDRTLLANALESTAQNDIKKKYIADN